MSLARLRETVVGERDRRCRAGGSTVLEERAPRAVGDNLDVVHRVPKTSRTARPSQNLALDAEMPLSKTLRVVVEAVVLAQVSGRGRRLDLLRRTARRVGDERDLVGRGPGHRSPADETRMRVDDAGREARRGRGGAEVEAVLVAPGGDVAADDCTHSGVPGVVGARDPGERQRNRGERCLDLVALPHDAVLGEVLARGELELVARGRRGPCSAEGRGPREGVRGAARFGGPEQEPVQPVGRAGAAAAAGARASDAMSTVRRRSEHVVKDVVGMRAARALPRTRECALTGSAWLDQLRYAIATTSEPAKRTRTSASKIRPRR